MKPVHLLLIVLLSALTALGTVLYLGPVGVKNGKPAPQAAATTHESAYDSVMRTGTIRCGYIQYPMFVERNLNTGKMSGIYVDIIEEMGKRLSLKIDWAAEVGFADAFDALKAGRFDVMCFPFNQTPGRARVTEFSIPIIFAPSFLYARADDNRFDNNYVRANSPDVKMAFQEGNYSQIIHSEDFPKSQAVSLTGLADAADIFMEVTSGKADVVNIEPSTADDFMRNNPGKLKRVPGPPLRVQQVGVDVAVGEDSLLKMLNTTLESMLTSGFIEKTVNKYVTSPDQLYFPAPTWGASAHPAKEAKP